jgi:protein disulfide-isomerase A6
MHRAVALTALAVGAAGEAVELTDSNFDRLVFKSGKSAFVKFLAPW